MAISFLYDEPFLRKPLLWALYKVQLIQTKITHLTSSIMDTHLRMKVGELQRMENERVGLKMKVAQDQWNG